MSALDNAAVFRQFVDLLPFGAYIVDPARRVLYWNQRAEQITGFLSQEVLGRTCGETLLDHCAPGGVGVCSSAACPLAIAQREGRSTEARLFLRHKEGQRVPVLIRTIPLRDENGRVRAVAELFQAESVGPDGLCWISEHIDRFDREMGLPSAAASRAQLQLSLSRSDIQTAAFVVEIERLRDMAVNRGREMANVALRALAQTVSRLLTMPHYLGCWPDARLLAVVPNCGPELLQTVAESLENTGSACGVTWWGERVVCRVRVRATVLHQTDTLESLLNRIDPAESGAALQCS